MIWQLQLVFVEQPFEYKPRLSFEQGVPCRCIGCLHADRFFQRARVEDKTAAQALVAQAQGVITEVNAYKDGAKVFAPADAEIQTIIPNEGEIVNAGYPVMNLIDTQDEWVVFNIREDKMADFKIGTKFKGIVPALGNQEIEMEVKHIAVQADFATWTATKSKGDFDKKTFAIKAYPTQKVKDLRPGMSVLVSEK